MSALLAKVEADVKLVVAYVGANYKELLVAAAVGALLVHVL